MARRKYRANDQGILKFVHAAKFSGFQASGLSAYNNVDPHTVIRELAQNALDAASEAKRDVIRIVFEIAHTTADQIPGLEQYRERLQCAIKTQKAKNNLAQSQAIVNAMQSTIDAKRVPVLWVSDNGVGLNEQGMEDLLGDGQSGKADESTAGSYGNGHMTSFPASDLRYILYGGVHTKGRTVSGHAILATHVHDDMPCGEDGYLADQVRVNDIFNRFEFYDGSRMPLLTEKLNWIEEKFSTGSVVGILGFNRFNRCSSNEEVLDVVETVIATHFTPVLYAGRMEIVLRSNSQTLRTLDKNSVRAVLSRRQQRDRRDRNSIGPSGRQAWETLETLKPEYAHTIETKAGIVRFHFRELPRSSSGGTHLQLFRNGMWITNAIPHNRASDYRDVVPFSGVMLLAPEDAPEACGLVGKFEGPRHIDIDLKRHKRGSLARKDLDELLKNLRKCILQLVPNIDTQEFDPGFFSVEVEGDGVRQNPKFRSAGIGTPERMPKPEPVGPLRPPNPNPPDPSRARRLRRQGLRLDTRVAAVRQTQGISIRVVPLEDAKNVELRVILANGTDETCDNPNPDHYLEIGEGASMDGQPVKAYVRDRHGKRRAVLIGPVSKSGEELDIWLPCRPSLTGDIRVELVRRATTKAGA